MVNMLKNLLLFGGGLAVLAWVAWPWMDSRQHPQGGINFNNRVGVESRPLSDQAKRMMAEAERERVMKRAAGQNPR